MPEVEWWDEFLMPPDSERKNFPKSGICPDDVYRDRITHYVQHPVKIRNSKLEEINKIVPSVYLTDKEKKRLSRNKRVEKEKDKQERIKLGLMEAPAPKIKMSNYTKIMAKDAIVDPSGTEIVAKAIVEHRFREHLQRNEERKLTSA